MQKIIKIFDKFLNQNDTLIIGVSGGVDSIVLLDLIYQYSKKQSLNVIIVHVNHNLRGKESDNDEKLVKKYAEKYGVKFEGLKLKWSVVSGQWSVNAKKIANLEAKCRAKRYEFFGKLQKKYNAKYIVLAHHLNDNIETFFLNFIRGASINGLCGMKICEGDIFRPLINITKEEILAYAKEKKLKWNEDYTNTDEKFARNRIRNKILPEIKKINSGFEKTFLNNLTNLRELADYLKSEMQNPPSPLSNKRGEYNVKDFRKMHIAQQKMFLVELYKHVNGSTYFLQSSHIDEILKMLNSGKGNVKKEFGKGKFLKIDKGSIKII